MRAASCLSSKVWRCRLLCCSAAHRFQSQLPGQGKYRRVVPSLLAIGREEGLAALYKGFVPKALRLGIGQSVGLVMFEQVRLVMFEQVRRALHGAGRTGESWGCRHARV
eukprot:GHRQ01038039.1.p4 GENE.GHRQ01038039.1~~GHRQ01038039.1.p4  ORF type:complete len:109 (-),score=42.66 GHRQ01038039.1:297-623(-)